MGTHALGRTALAGIVGIAVVATLGGTTQNSPAEPPCALSQFRQFDFWVGVWDVSWPPSETSDRKPGRGTNHVEAALDGCAVVERFDGSPGLPLRGMSLSMFVRRTGRWQQTWVDNFGSYLDFVGEFKDGQMILAREAVGADGKKFLQRMVWKNITAQSLDWSWERSDDRGRSWMVMWPIRYVRRQPAPSPVK